MKGTQFKNFLGVPMSAKALCVVFSRAHSQQRMGSKALGANEFDACENAKEVVFGMAKLGWTTVTAFGHCGCSSRLGNPGWRPIQNWI